MRRIRIAVHALLGAAFAALAARPAEAASLAQVNNWQGGVTLPADVTMFVYVPNNVATNPPLLTLIHFCGGNASSVFGQASRVVPAAGPNRVLLRRSAK